MNGCEHEYEICHSITEGVSVGCGKCRKACRILPKLKKWSELAGYLLVFAGILVLDPSHTLDKWWEFLLVAVAIILTIPLTDWLEYRLLLRARKKGTIDKYIALLPGRKYIPLARREAAQKLFEAYEELFAEATDKLTEDSDSFHFDADDEEEPFEYGPDSCGHEYELHYGVTSGLEIVCPICGQTGRRKRGGLSVWRPVLALLTLAACVFLSVSGVSIDEYFLPVFCVCAPVYFTAAWLEYRMIRREQKAGRLEKYVWMP